MTADRLTVAQCHALAVAYLAVHRPGLDILPGAHVDAGAAVFGYGDPMFPDIQPVGNGPLWIDRLTGEARFLGSIEQRDRIDAMTEVYDEHARTWHARTPDGVVCWGPGLIGDPAAVGRIRFALLSSVAPIDVTPTGPSIPRDEADELAVFASITEVYGTRATFDGDLPDLTSGAPGAVF